MTFGILLLQMTKKKIFASLIEKWRSQIVWKSPKMSHSNFHDNFIFSPNSTKNIRTFAKKTFWMRRFWMIFHHCKSRKFSSKNWVYASKSKGLWRMLWGGSSFSIFGLAWIKVKDFHSRKSLRVLLLHTDIPLFPRKLSA